MRRIFTYLFFILSIIVADRSYSFCPTPDFLSPDTSCINQNIYFENNAINENTIYSWDFCTGDLESIDTSRFVLNNSLLYRARSLKIIQDQKLWYGFGISQTDNKMFRLDFGDNLENSPTLSDLGNPSNYLSGSYSLDIIKSEGTWHAFAVNTGNNSIIKYVFENGIDKAPVAEDLGNFNALNIPNHIELVKDNENFLAFISNGGTSEIIALNFGTSLDNTPSINTINIPGSNNLRGIGFIKDCSTWYGLALSYSNNKVYGMEFTNGLENLPIVNEISFGATSFHFPANVEIRPEGGQFYAFIQGALGDFYRIDFDTTISGFIGSAENLGNLGLWGDNFALDIVADSSNHYGFNIDLSSRNLVRIDFSNPCSVSLPIYSGSDPPPIYYQSSGSFKISLSADSLGHIGHFTKNLEVSPDLSAQIDIGTNNICLESEIEFKGILKSGSVESWSWDFGDGSGSSNTQDTIYNFSSAGNYQIGLQISSLNGCQNTAIKSLDILSAPIPYFNLSDSLVCTNNQIDFINQSLEVVDSLTTWNWYINDTLYSSQKDTSIQFIETSDKSIRLTAEIPGCFRDSIRLFQVITGPIAGFSFENVCDNEALPFNNNSSGSIISNHWDFGDSTTSTLMSPFHLYDSANSYPVTLNVISENGCQNKLTRDVVVYAIPQADFSNELACHNTDVQFTDISTVQSANIIKWDWHYVSQLNEVLQGSDTLKNPLLNFPDHGNYFVSLVAESNYGCTDSIVYIINVLPSPESDFTNNISCLGDTTFFSSNSTIESGYTILDWSWEIDQNMYYDTNPSHLFNAPGDYEIMLMVRADNLCEDRITRMITMSPLPEADFINHNNCLNETILLQSTARSQEDPVSLYSWEIDNGTNLTGYQVGLRFDTAGDYSIKHIVTTNLGCIDSLTKIITINSSPTAVFNSLPNFGAPPLNISFENESTGADTYNWYFNDGTGNESSETNPVYIYTDVGKFLPALVAYNDMGCKDSITSEVNIVQPVTDVSLNTITEVRINNKRKFILNISNLGTTHINDMEIIISINGQYDLVETFQDEIPANESINYTLNFELLDAAGQDLHFLCIQLNPVSILYPDINNQNNQECLTSNEDFVILDPYPNPVSDNLYLNILLPEKEDLTIQMVSSNGQIKWHRQITDTKKGLNKIIIQMDEVPTGVYILNIAYKGSLVNRQVVVN